MLTIPKVNHEKRLGIARYSKCGIFVSVLYKANLSQVYILKIKNCIVKTEYLLVNSLKNGSFQTGIKELYCTRIFKEPLNTV